MKNFSFLAAILMLATVLTLSIAACDSGVTPTPELASPEVATNDAFSKAEKIDICHYDKDNNTYFSINISVNAEAAHRAHGDGQVGEAVPGMEDYEFDAYCVPVLACPCWYSATLPESADDSFCLEGEGFHYLAIGSSGESWTTAWVPFFDPPFDFCVAVLQSGVVVSDVTEEEANACADTLRPLCLEPAAAAKSELPSSSEVIDLLPAEVLEELQINN